MNVPFARAKRRFTRANAQKNFTKRAFRTPYLPKSYTKPNFRIKIHGKGHSIAIERLQHLPLRKNSRLFYKILLRRSRGANQPFRKFNRAGKTKKSLKVLSESEKGCTFANDFRGSAAFGQTDY